jgi:hypothetical protein
MGNRMSCERRGNKLPATIAASKVREGTVATAPAAPLEMPERLLRNLKGYFAYDRLSQTIKLSPDAAREGVKDLAMDSKELLQAASKGTQSSAPIRKPPRQSRSRMSRRGMNASSPRS